MSVYNIATNGLSVQANRFAQSANAIASFNAPVAAPSNPAPVDMVSIDASLIALSVAKQSYKADVEVIQTQQDMDQTLLNIIS